MGSNWTRQAVSDLETLRKIRTDFRAPGVLVYVKSERAWYVLNSAAYSADEKIPYIIKPLQGEGSWRRTNPDKPFVSQVQMKSLSEYFPNGDFLNSDFLLAQPSNFFLDLFRNRRVDATIKRLQRIDKSIFLFTRYNSGEEYFFQITNNSGFLDTYWKADDEQIKIHVLNAKMLFTAMMFIFTYGWVDGISAPRYAASFTPLSARGEKESDSKRNARFLGFQETALLEWLIQQATQTISITFDSSFGITPTDDANIIVIESKIFNSVLNDKQRVFLPCAYNPDASAPHSKGVFAVQPPDAPSTDLFKPPYNFGDNITLHNNPWQEPLKITMVEVPPGKFQRDSSSANISEITYPFQVSKYLITRYQFRTIMNVDPSVNTTNNTTNAFDKSGLYFEDPICNLLWVDAVAFCIKLSLIEGLKPVYTIKSEYAEFDLNDVWATANSYAINVDEIAWLIQNTIPSRVVGAAFDAEGLPRVRTVFADLLIDSTADGYRLLTEMEYMWAMMGAPETGQNGNTDTSGWNKPFAGGGAGALANDYTVNQTNSGPTNNDSTPRTTRFVGSKLPNELGLYDMSGNVFCYLHDRWATLPSGLLLNYTNEEETTHFRVVKGGAFNRPLSELAVTFRGSRAFGTLHASNYLNTGFRICRRVPDAP